MKARDLIRSVIGMLLAGALILSFAAVSAQGDADAQPFLGLTFANDPGGARVTGVLPGGPADEAGLEIGDIVLSLNGEEVTGDNIAALVADMNVGDTVTLSVDRGADTLDIVATLAARDAALNFPQAAPESPAAQTQQGAFLGVSLQDTFAGVNVREVVPGSPAEVAGLQVNDVIVAIDGDRVENSLQLTSAIRALTPGDAITLDITRDGEEQTIEATLAEAPANVPLSPTTGGLLAEGFGVSVDGTNWTINNLTDNHPLYAAGLREGDVVTQFNGETHDARSLLPFIALAGADSTVTLTVERDGETQEIDVPAGDLIQLAIPTISSDFRRGFGGPFNRGGQSPFGWAPFDFDFGLPFAGTLRGGRLGVTVQNLDEQVADDLNVSVTEGALVQAVAEESAAAEAGLQVNDVITAVDGDLVDQERTLRDRLVAYEPGDTITLTVLRDGETLEVEATLTEAAPMEVQFFGRPNAGQRFGSGRGDKGDEGSMPPVTETEDVPSA